ncbi:hypothetical protein SeLEV6574_g06307 [Synchytrium endobioticum]|uniref:Uncharacterized protein n=1 Tax=Synchytrium endobioticum TaxID=286115 RepID=A0A507CPB5_9FUNG|nr:hypothetical protein SeLEV6574_g06307 [Synchytrium endobioticum]
MIGSHQLANLVMPGTSTTSTPAAPVKLTPPTQQHPLALPTYININLNVSSEARKRARNSAGPERIDHTQQIGAIFNPNQNSHQETCQICQRCPVYGGQNVVGAKLKTLGDGPNMIKSLFKQWFDEKPALQEWKTVVAKLFDNGVVVVNGVDSLVSGAASFRTLRDRKWSGVPEHKKKLLMSVWPFLRLETIEAEDEFGFIRNLRVYAGSESKVDEKLRLLYPDGREGLSNNHRIHPDLWQQLLSDVDHGPQWKYLDLIRTSLDKWRKM